MRRLYIFSTALTVLPEVPVKEKSDVFGGYRIGSGSVVDGTIVVVGATAAVGSGDDDEDDDDVGLADGELDRWAMGCMNDGTIDEGCSVGFGFVKGAADTVGTTVPVMVGQGVQEHTHVHAELRYCLPPSLPSTILTANPFPVDNESDVAVEVDTDRLH